MNHAFEMPVVVPPQIAEDFEGVEEQGRRSKGKVKAVVRAKVGVAAFVACRGARCLWGLLVRMEAGGRVRELAL